jgi:protein-tyrosine kinase
MSRIHEALKRAEREGLPTLPPTNPPPTQTVELIATEPSAGPGSTIGPESVSPNFPSLRFENLWNSCTETRWVLDPNFSAFANPNAFPILGEQFRNLRSRLYQIRESQNIHRILVTSGNPGEGKTFVAANLAQALARKNGARVLLIDGDLRCSKLHTALGARSTPGLSEYLAGQIDAAGVLQKGLPEHLCFIPAGNHVTHPADLLSNGRLKELLDQFGQVFDWIVVDSPPAISVADANILAGLCDGTLFVVRAGSTPATTLQNFRQQLPGRKIVGVILNAAEQAQVYGSSYSGYMRGPQNREPGESTLPLRRSASKALFPADAAVDSTKTRTKSEQRS